MAVKVTLTCTDRQGRVLARQATIGQSFDSTAEERGKIYTKWLKTYTDMSDVSPYIFTSTENTRI